MGITTETIDVFRTSDGKPHTDETAARSHQAALDHGAMLDAYEKENKALFTVQGASGRMRGAVLPFLGWLEKKGVKFPEFEAPVEEAPKAAA